ncbi:PWI domain-containing protein [Cephalotus follicularis]|uniref:PWI domain-containing protein n=1 Tax=Cephalotus follicularis TaxID=3775 RepID=A0A1Q3CDH2_CEPFO|nr:PWI domain-containing protein [Cephalotus follicularis]
MSGGFFRGTSADQDTRFSNKQAKLMKSQKFPPELEHLVDMSKVEMNVIRPWIASRVTELLGFEDEVLINFIYGLLDGKDVNGKEIQISLTGFMEKNTGKFMKELWTLLLSAQNNASGVPQQLLDAKEEEIRKKQAEQDHIANEIQKKKEKESRELEEERSKKMDGEVESNATNTDLEPISKNMLEKPSNAHSEDEKETGKRNGVRRNRVSRSPHSVDRSPLSPRDSRSRSISKSLSNSRSYSDDRHRSSSRSPNVRRRSISPRRRSVTPRRNSRVSPSPPRRKSTYFRRRSRSRSLYRSPSPLRRRVRSPFRRRSPSPFRRRRSPSPVRHRRSPSPVRRRRSPSPLHHRSPLPVRRRSPPPTRDRSPSPMHRRSPLPLRRGSPPSPVHRGSPSPMHRGSLSPVRRRSPLLVRRRSPSPVRRRYASPIRRRSPLPVRRRSPSPMRRRSSPAQRRSPSPIRRRYQRSPLTPHHNSPSPVRYRSPIAGRRRSPMTGRRRSPTPSLRRSPSAYESSSPSFQRRSPSPVGSRSIKGRRRSPVQSPRERIRPSISLRSPQRDPTDRKVIPKKGPTMSPSAEKSPVVVESPAHTRKGSVSEYTRSLSPYNSPARQTRGRLMRDGSFSPSQKPREQKPRHASPEINREEEENDRAREDRVHKSKSSQKRSLLSSTVNKQEDSPIKVRYQEDHSPDMLAGHRATDSRNPLDNVESRKKVQEKSANNLGRVHPETPDQIRSTKLIVDRKLTSNSVEGERSDERDRSRTNNVKESGGHHQSETVPMSVEKVEDSGIEESGKRMPDVREKRRHKRSERRQVASDDAYSYDSHSEGRKEAKKRRKEEKKLRKEDKRRRREERRRKRELRRAEKLKVKNQYDASASDDEHVPRKESCPSDDEVMESEQKKLEIELRKKALESLKAKKGINH